MPDCPKCHTALSRRKNNFGVFWFCERCEGSAVTMSLLRKVVAKEALNGLWQRVRLGAYPRKHPCPGCRRNMEQITLDAEGKTRAVDVCSSCQFVWLDPGEWADLAFYKIESKSQADLTARVRANIEARRQAIGAPPPQEPIAAVVEPHLQPPRGAIIAEERTVHSSQRRERVTSPRKKKPLAESRKPRKETPSPSRHKPRRDFERLKPRVATRPAKAKSGWGQGPTEFWQWLPALLGMPVEDAQPVGRPGRGEKPWFTWTLAAGITLVSLLAMFDLRAVIDAYGLIPAEFERLYGFTWLASFFLHAGLLHLVGNVYFLLIFGDNVEKCLGTLEFFLLLVLATLCGDFVHILMDPDSTVPCVGASGGISGVIAFYALRFPKNQLAMMFWFFFKTYWWRMSALWMFGIWLCFQFFIAGQQMVGISQVSGGAHLGGALVGVAAWALWRFNGGALDASSAHSKS